MALERRAGQTMRNEWPQTPCLIANERVLHSPPCLKGQASPQGLAPRGPKHRLDKHQKASPPAASPDPVFIPGNMRGGWYLMAGGERGDLASRLPTTRMPPPTLLRAPFPSALLQPGRGRCCLMPPDIQLLSAGNASARRVFFLCACSCVLRALSSLKLTSHFSGLWRKRKAC